MFTIRNYPHVGESFTEANFTSSSFLEFQSNTLNLDRYVYCDNCTTQLYILWYIDWGYYLRIRTYTYIRTSLRNLSLCNGSFAGDVKLILLNQLLALALTFILSPSLYSNTNKPHVCHSNHSFSNPLCIYRMISSSAIEITFIAMDGNGLLLYIGPVSQIEMF